MLQGNCGTNPVKLTNKSVNIAILSIESSTPIKLTNIMKLGFSVGVAAILRAVRVIINE